MRDFKRLMNDAPAGIFGVPDEDNIMSWHGVIFGPEDTPWEGGTFKLTLEFTEEYPNKAPVVKFVSRMFHPNSLLLNQKSTRTRTLCNHLQQDMHKQSTRTEASASTSCRTCGARSMTWQAS